MCLWWAKLTISTREPKGVGAHGNKERKQENNDVNITISKKVDVLYISI